MPTVTAGTNCWTQAEDAVIAALPELATFRAMVEAADTAAAAEKVFLDELPEAADFEAVSIEESERLFGYALVYSGVEQPYQYRVQNDVEMAGGSVDLILSRLVREKDRQKAAENDREARNWIGSIAQELVDHLRLNKGRMWCGEARVAEGPNFPTRDNRDSGVAHFWEARLSFDWGHPALRGEA